jgi:uncharacterized protein (DUF1800 family)
MRTTGSFAFAIVFGMLSLQSASAFYDGGTGASQFKAAGQGKSTDDQKILHLLNRIGYGPRPEDIAKVKRIGLAAYVEEQLYPERINDSALEQKLQGFAELQLSDEAIAAKYKEFITTDQQAAKLRQKMRKEVAAKTGETPPAVPGALVTGKAGQAAKELMASDPELMKQIQDTREQLAKAAEPVALLHEEFVAAKLVRAVESQRQLQEVLVDFWSNHFNIDTRKAPCGVLKVIDDRNVIRPHIFGKFRDLLAASAKSPAMLVYLDNFQSVADQLPAVATARTRRGKRQVTEIQNGSQTIYFNPANKMLPTSVPPAPVAPAQTGKRKVGLNENYAREIMELHTLGVNGGYTQQDVREVARCLTGWSIASTDGVRPRINRYGEAGVYQFFPRLHDDGEKTVLGHRIPAGGGEHDGEVVLDLLSHDPATRKHISYQLCQRLVCDEPSTQLVNRCVEVWQHTDGDLREVVRAIITSPDFYSAQAMRKKIKSPFEYAVSSVRALDGHMDVEAMISRKQLAREANLMVRPPKGGGYMDVNTTSLLGQVATMGQPLFQYQAPTGFPEDSRKWVSSGALISRLNFSLSLTQGKLKDVMLTNLSEDAGAPMDARKLIDKLSGQILHGEVSPSTRATLLKEAGQSDAMRGDAALPPATIAALLLGSPEFQRR